MSEGVGVRENERVSELGRDDCIIKMRLREGVTVDRYSDTSGYVELKTLCVD